MKTIAWWLWRNEWIPIPARLLPYVLGAALGRRPRRVR